MAIHIAEHPARPFRIPQAEMTQQQADLVRRILSGPRKDLPVNMEIWLQSPQFAEVANSFAEYVGHLAPMTKRIKEITILVVAAYWGSAFEWFWHERLSRQLGLTEAQLDGLKKREPVRFEDPKEQAAYDLAYALMERRNVDDELYARAVDVLGHGLVSDLVGLIGLYTMVAFSLDFYRVPVPDNVD
jgi:4-carboxymuconolactone decarboxylase